MKNPIPADFGSRIAACLDDFEPFIRQMMKKHGQMETTAAIVEMLAQGVGHPATRRAIYQRLMRGFADVAGRPKGKLRVVR